MAGHPRRQQIGRRYGEHRPEEREVRHPRPVDRLGERHPVGRAIAAPGHGVEAQPGGTGVRDPVELCRALRISGEGQQL